jgi:predicted 2-oxoglutarate/Fe(II)-dependent dioxygenase YbiX
MKFFYYWFQCFSKEESIKFLHDIDEITKSNINEFGDLGAPGKNLSKVTIIESIMLPTIANRFFNKVSTVNQEMFGFKLYKELPKITNINYYSSQNLSDYPYHIDGAELGTYHDIKLTGIINLSPKPYKGGEFKIMINQEPMLVEELNTTGNAIVFPSFFLHKVEPVIEGERISLSCWFYGPNWK